MQTLYYSIMDFVFTLETPFPIEIFQESEPFLIEKRDQIDGRISFEMTDDLTEPILEDGFWRGSHYYVNQEGCYMVYYFDPKQKVPYVKISYEDERHLRIQYISTLVYLSRTSTYMLRLMGLERLLLQHRGFMLHASVVNWKGRGILFSGPSGAGKSTQADLWKKCKKGEIINGDRAGIRKKGDVWKAYGLPYAGSSGIYKNESVTIEMLVFLSHGKKNRIKKLTVSESIQRILRESFVHHWEDYSVSQTLSIISEMIQTVPVYMMECRPDEDSVELVYELVTEKEQNI